MNMQIDIVNRGQDSDKAGQIAREIMDVRLMPEDNQRLADLCGQFDEHLKQIEQRLQVEINRRGNVFRVVGQSVQANKAALVLDALYTETETESLDPEKVQLCLQDAGIENLMQKQDQPAAMKAAEIRLRSKTIKTRGDNQSHYIAAMVDNDINFGIGPAGTGKTYLAVAAAVRALEEGRVQRLILARPAVEAGERLGFLPGDLAQKVDPYLRPLYDALYEMLGFDYVTKLIEKHVIEVAPLAFMRGRTLNEAFVILDEAQNTTPEQMKMFLTRIGFGSTVVVTGDLTQTDLPVSRQSGLGHVVQVLKNIDGISFTHFDQKDVVRHPLVQRVVAAYDHWEKKIPPEASQ